MRLSELSERSGVSIPMIKYYARESLLPPGAKGKSNHAIYDESHVRRLRLIRALVEIAQLSLEDIRATLAVVDDPSIPRSEVVHAAAKATRTVQAPSWPPDLVTAYDDVEAILAELGWEVPSWAGARLELAQALVLIRDYWGDASMELVHKYARLAEQAAGLQVEELPRLASRDDMLTAALTSRLAGDAMIVALTRLAYANQTSRGVIGDEADAPEARQAG